MPSIRLERVTFAHADAAPILADVDLHLSSGWTALVGENGAGKTESHEPTNHLDLPTVERLEAALAAYPGALLLVTHDDAFAERCTASRWRIASGRVETT